jgi:hypothetical protein
MNTITAPTWREVSTLTPETLAQLQGRRARYCGPFVGSDWYVGTIQGDCLWTDDGSDYVWLPSVEAFEVQD